MNTSKSTQFYFRIIHRYLGFFLAGIMTVYALSGVLLVFRTTDFLKTEKLQKVTIKPALTINEVGQALKIKNIALVKAENAIYYFKNGTYNSQTGEAQFTEKKWPVILEKMTHLHKATTNDPLFYLNIFFGVSLLFFAISSFFMFLPKAKAFKTGMYYALGGMLLTLLMLFI